MGSPLSGINLMDWTHKQKDTKKIKFRPAAKSGSVIKVVILALLLA
jgi:hypothetical protein